MLRETAVALGPAAHQTVLITSLVAREPRGVWIAALLFVAVLCIPGEANACESNEQCAAASPDGSRVVFTTEDPLVPEDESRYSIDVYELLNGRTTRLLTPDPAGATFVSNSSYLKGLSHDGGRVIIQTGHAYTPLDVETTPYPEDLYVLEGGVWSLVTPEPAGPLPILAGYSEDARHVYFETSAGLAPNDTDADFDLYEWNDGTARIVSTGPTERTTPPDRPNFSYNGPGIFGAATEDGSQVYFNYNDELTPDADSELSTLYLRRNASTTEWIQLPGSEGGGVKAVSPDGSRLIVATFGQIDPFDTDNQADLYVRGPGGEFTLLSRGPAAGNGNGPECGISTDCSARYEGMSRSGDRVFFSTFERLVGEDIDTTFDIYERFGSTTTLVTPGTEDQQGSGRFVRAPQFEGVSGDGTQVAFSTWSQLVPADKDSRPDIYVRSGGDTHLISTGPAVREAKFDPVFADFVDSGDNVIFWTRQPLVPADNDESGDIYQRIDFNKAPGNAATASAAGKRKGNGKKGKRRAKVPGKTRLISAERIAPRVRVSGRGRIRGGRAQVRISCPKREESGSCSGTAKAAGAGKGAFKVKRGRSTWVSVGRAAAVGRSAAITVRAKDALGNRARARKSVRF
jgi:hypothetical protein